MVAMVVVTTFAIAVRMRAKNPGAALTSARTVIGAADADAVGRIKAHPSPPSMEKTRDAASVTAGSGTLVVSVSVVALTGAVPASPSFAIVVEDPLVAVGCPPLSTACVATVSVWVGVKTSALTTFTVNGFSAVVLFEVELVDVPPDAVGAVADFATVAEASAVACCPCGSVVVTRKTYSVESESAA